jgi:hypothetical protein
LELTAARGAAAAIVAAFMLLPSVAGAAGAGAVSLPDEFSAADQYVESVPTSRGPNRPGLEKRRKAPLPPAVNGRIEREGGSDATELEQIATSPDLGAPSQQSAAASGRKAYGARSTSSPSVPSAAVTALGGEDGGLPWLPVALVLITALAVGTAGYRHHRYKSSAG